MQYLLGRRALYGAALVCLMFGAIEKCIGAEAKTPETRALTAAEAARVFERDWLFQAMGEPLLDRAYKEIAWARELADRLVRSRPALDLSSELRALEALEKEKLPAKQGSGPKSIYPSWIWYPEGNPAESAPAGDSRFFRCRINVPSKVDTANLFIRVDDSCQVYLNGFHLGIPQTLNSPGFFGICQMLRTGSNVLAVRAKNHRGPSRNPAGLIARVTVNLDNGKCIVLDSDDSWRVAKQKFSGWEQKDFDDSTWKKALVAAAWGKGLWGKIGREYLASNPAAYANELPAHKDFYFRVRRVKHSIMLKNPVLDFSKLLFIDQPWPKEDQWSRGWFHINHETIHRLGKNASPGGRLLVLDGLHPGGKLSQLAPDKPGSFWRPELSFDARKVLFCYKPHDDKAFHLYEMNIDGTGVKQLTDGDYDDIDPIYLPDGHILFTTTRGNTYIRCGPYIYSSILARCDADGSNIYLTSYNSESDFVPSLLNDGRVIYSRWEYTDKPLWRLQKLWTTNQDGTGTAHFWGNQSVWPDHLSEPRAIPGSRRVMFSGVGHHDWWSGSIGIIDPDKGRDWPDGLTKVTGDLRWPEVSIPPKDPLESADYHASGGFTGYKTAYPLSEEDFLVSARGINNKFRLYLMDVHGNRDLVYEGKHNIWHAVPLKPRPVPPAQPDMVEWPGTGKDRKPAKMGTFFSADVCEGVPELSREKVKYLRVFQQDYKTYTTWNKTFRHSGPVVSVVQEDSVKRILSEVPVEADGSVHFEAPAGQAVFFQLLDADRRCLQTMRSFTGLMPTERRSCVGCHEMQPNSPMPKPTGRAIAQKRPPTKLSPPPWGTESIGYERFVQPVLDRYCVECHNGKDKDTPEPNLTLRPVPEEWVWRRRRAQSKEFKEPYLTLVGTAGWVNPIAKRRTGSPGYGIAGTIPVESGFGQNDPKALETLPPMKYLSYTSRLIDLASSGKHHDVKVDPLSLHRLIAWVDACCPFNGEEEIRAMEDPSFEGMEQLPIRPRVKTAPDIQRP